MCGTLKRSRTIVTPARGTGSGRPGPSGPTPNPSDLNFVIRSSLVTWSKSGVSASYMQRLLVGADWRRRGPVLAGRNDVARDGGVVVSEGRGGRSEERRRRNRGDPGHGAARYTRCSPLSPLPSPSSAPPNVEAARDYAATRPGTVAFAVRTPTTFEGVDEDRAFNSASVLKAMLLVAYTRSAAGRPLRADEKRLLDPMIRKSDNAATNVIFTRVGTTGLKRLRRPPGWRASSRPARSGATRGSPRATRPGSSWPSTRCCPRATAPTACGSCARSSPSQRWGIGRLELPDWQVYFKGGWGSGTGAVDHQVALLVRGEERIAIAVLTADNGSHAAGKKTLEGVFRSVCS